MTGWAIALGKEAGPDAASREQACAMKVSAGVRAVVAIWANEYDAGVQLLNLPVVPRKPVHPISALQKESACMKILPLLPPAPQVRVGV